MLKRLIALDLPKGQSAFFFGPRKTGKTTYLKYAFPESKFYDLLQTDVLARLVAAPHLLREELIALDKLGKLKQPIIIDEIQKIPALLDEVHWLIENKRFSFILCGSSARKLRAVGVNLLGGRAWNYKFFPFTYLECKNFDLLTAMNRGLVPSHYLSKNYKKFLESYCSEYLTYEIKNEGLVRNLPAFAKFLDSVGFINGELINYSNIAADCGVSSNTVKEYLQILVDTLLGNFIYPFKIKHKRAVITSTPKFYLFDIGIANWLARTSITELRGFQAGRSFEQFIFMELNAYISYKEKYSKIFYWRTKTGLEVDFVIDNAKIALECKISAQVKKTSLSGLIAFVEEHDPKKAIVISQDRELRLIYTQNKKEIMIMPWQIFLEELWTDKIF